MDEADDDLPARLSRLVTSVDVPSGPPVVSFNTASASRTWRGGRALAVAAGIVVVAGVAAVVWAASVDRSTQITSGPSEPQGPTIDGRPTDPLALVLFDLGVDLERAPAGLLDEGPQVCGLLNDVVAEADRCFLHAHLAHIPAVLVQAQTTTEGDPFVIVHRTAADGAYDYLVDATRDAFGSGQWEHGTCRTLRSIPASEPAGRVVPFHVDGCDELRLVEDGDVLPSLGPTPTVPDWFSERSRLRLCGIDVRVEDNDRAGRSCFADAVAAGEPAELAYRSTGDEGELAALWYRSLAGGGVEVIERQIPVAGDPAGPAGRWLRYECASAGLLDEPGSEVDMLPSAHTGPDCSIVEEAPG